MEIIKRSSGTLNFKEIGRDRRREIHRMNRRLYVEMVNYIYPNGLFIVGIERDLEGRCNEKKI